MDAQSYFSTKLVDMGELDSRLAGIWTPESQLSSVPVGLTEQFTEHAGNYAAKYCSPVYFRRLIVRALALSGGQIGRAPRILDNAGPAALAALEARNAAERQARKRPRSTVFLDRLVEAILEPAK